MTFSAQDYPKLSQSYYGLLECLAQDHMPFISNLEPQVLLYILSTISEGLTALGKLHMIQGCAALLLFRLPKLPGQCCSYGPGNLDNPGSSKKVQPEYKHQSKREITSAVMISVML